MTKTGWLVAGIIVLVAAVAFLWWNSASAPAVDQGAATTVPTGTMAVPNDTMATTTIPSPVTLIIYGDDGFSPETVTIPVGTKVEFVDRSTENDMWVASAQHPSHTTYDNTSATVHCAPGYTGPAPFDQCSTGTSFVFVFDKTGTWKYHTHKNASAFGTIVVQ